MSFGVWNYDFWLICTDAEGDSLWSLTFGGMSEDRCKTIIQTTDGGFALTGNTRSYGMDPGRTTDFWLVRTGHPDSAPPFDDQTRPTAFMLLHVYPNPFNSTIKISYNLLSPFNVSLDIYDPLGNSIASLYKGYRQAGFHTNEITTTNLTSGLYFVRLEAGREVWTQKILLMR